MALNPGTETLDLDDMDLKILKLLSKDSKMSFADMGKEIHLTAPAVHGRVKKLERHGIIKGYGVEIDYERIGLSVIAFVKVRISAKLRCKDAGKQFMAFSEIEECHAVAGEDDLIIKTRTSTPLALHNMLDKMKTQGLIEKSSSLLVLESYFSRSRL